MKALPLDRGEEMALASAALALRFGERTDEVRRLEMKNRRARRLFGDGAVGRSQIRAAPGRSRRDTSRPPMPSASSNADAGSGTAVTGGLPEVRPFPETLTSSRPM